MFTHTIMENACLLREIYKKIASREKSYSAILSRAVGVDCINDNCKSLFFNEFEIKWDYNSITKSFTFFAFGPLNRDNKNVFGQFLWFKVNGTKVDFEGNSYISESEEKLILKFLDDLYNLNQYKDSILQEYF